MIPIASRDQFKAIKIRKFVGELNNELNNSLFLSRNRTIGLFPRGDFHVLKTNMLVLRTSSLQGATIRPIN